MYRSFRFENDPLSGLHSLSSLSPIHDVFSSGERRSEGYDEFFDPPLESKYECPICLLGLRDPVQTPCGHRFCKGCIKRSLRDAGPKCPVDNEPLLETQINPDNFARREMMEFTVCCRLKKEHGCPWKGPLGDLQINPDNFARREMMEFTVCCRLKKERGCPWKGPLGELQAHLDECPFADVECSNGCGKKLQRQKLQEHQNGKCSKRRVTCEHCNGTVPIADFEDHLPRCPKLKLTCENCGTTGIPREDMPKHLQKVCPNVRSKCPFSVIGCTFEGQRQEVDDHIKKENTSHICDLAIAFQEWKQTRQSQSSPGEAAAAAASTRTRRRVGQNVPGESAFGDDNFHQFFDEISSKCNGNQRELDEVRRLTNESAAYLPVLERRQDETRVRHDRQLQEILHRLQRMETKMLEYEGRVCSGTYIWRIENFRQCRQDAVNNVMTAIHSPPFYTSLYGYKMCMRINLNGVDSGLGRHVSLFIHMMQGDWDSILLWPFTGRISLSILDQTENSEFRRHISETLVAKPNLLAFQKPTAPRNHKGYGYVEFAQIDQLQEPQYVKSNVMLIKVQIFH